MNTLDQIKASAYMIGTYMKDDPDFLEGVEEGDIVICMKPTKENIELAKKLYKN